MVKAAPKIQVETCVTITMPTGTARILWEMFDYAALADIYQKHVCGQAISIRNIERTVEDVRDALGPAIRQLDDIDKAVKAILEGKS